MRDFAGRLAAEGARNWQEVLEDARPALQGQVRVGGAQIPMRTLIVGHALVPIDWPPEREAQFLAWWSRFARSMDYSQNPDHDRHDQDWRGLWWLGFRGFDRQGMRHTVRYAPNLRRVLQGHPPAVAPKEEQVFRIIRTS